MEIKQFTEVIRRSTDWKLSLLGVWHLGLAFLLSIVLDSFIVPSSLAGVVVYNMAKLAFMIPLVYRMVFIYSYIHRRASDNGESNYSKAAQAFAANWKGIVALGFVSVGIIVGSLLAIGAIITVLALASPVLAVIAGIPGIVLLVWLSYHFSIANMMGLFVLGSGQKYGPGLFLQCFAKSRTNGKTIFSRTVTAMVFLVPIVGFLSLMIVVPASAFAAASNAFGAGHGGGFGSGMFDLESMMMGMVLSNASGYTPIEFLFSMPLDFILLVVFGIVGTIGITTMISGFFYNLTIGLFTQVFDGVPGIETKADEPLEDSEPDPQDEG